MSKVIELEIRVPSSLYFISLDKYQRYMAIIDNVKDKLDESSDFINLKALEIFCGLELKESYKLPMSSFNFVLEQISKCLSEETPLVKRFTMRGTDGAEIEFGFHPNLKNMTFGEYIDLDSYISDWKKMNKAMAILYRPIIGSKKDMYRIEEYESSEKYSDLLKHMPASVALGAMVFFYRLGMKLAKRSVQYSLDQMETKDILKAESKFLEKNGVGINQFMLLLEVMSQNLTQLQKNHYISV